MDGKGEKSAVGGTNMYVSPRNNQTNGAPKGENFAFQGNLSNHTSEK
jgi:hypothetical protein